MTDFAPMTGPDPIETWFSEVIISAELNRPRTRQTAIGPSELGNGCERSLAYKVAGTTPVNFPDPLKANVGTGFHEYVGMALAGNSRYLLEHPVTYRGVSGSVDIFDRWHGRLIDVKTMPLTKLRRVRAKSVPVGHRVQVMTYAAGLIEQGENVRSLTLLYVPTDGTLADVYAATIPFDRPVADGAIDRLEFIQNKVADGMPATEFNAEVTPLCGWCAFYSPNRPLSSRSCPGGTPEAISEVLMETVNESKESGASA